MMTKVRRREISECKSDMDSPPEKNQSRAIIDPRRMCAVQAFCRRQNLGEGAIHLPRSKLKSGLPQKRELLWEMMAKVRRREISECKSDMKCPPETRKLQTGIIYHKIGGNARGEGGAGMAAVMRLFGCGECQVAGSNAPPIIVVAKSAKLRFHLR